MREYDCRDAHLFEWPIRVNFLEVWELSNEIEDWCKENLHGKFTCGDDGVYIYEEDDATAFKLRWL